MSLEREMLTDRIEARQKSLRAIGQTEAAPAALAFA